MAEAARQKLTQTPSITKRHQATGRNKGVLTDMSDGQSLHRFCTFQAEAPEAANAPHKPRCR